MTTIAEQNSAKAIDRMIKAVARSYGNAQQRVQAAGVAIIEHAKAYGDCSQAKKLARAVPARERNSLIGWFALYSPIGISMGKTAADDKNRFIRPESNNYHDFNVAGAKANMWWNDPAKANPEPKPLNTIIDFYKKIDDMLKRAIKDAEAEGRYDPEQREEVKEQAEELLTLVNKYRAKHLGGMNKATLAPKDDDDKGVTGDEKIVKAPAPRRAPATAKADNKVPATAH